MLDAEGEDDFSRNNKETRDRTLENSKADKGYYTDATDGTKHRASDMEADHIIPHSQGGDNSRRNLQFISRENNRKKSNDMSNTSEDYERRQKEIDAQNRSDEEYLKETQKIIDSNRKKWLGD